MIYFDNAATGGKKPHSVKESVCAAVNSLAANPGRSGHKLSLALAENILSCRKLLAEFFDVPSFDRVVFTKNCTEALNAAIFGLVNGIKDKIPHIVSTVMEHNSVLRPLFALERAGRITLTLTDLNEYGTVSAEDLAQNVQEDTAAVVFTLASNVTGAAIDAEKVCRLLPEKVIKICDGAQACGHIPVRLSEQGIDALAVAGHKGMHGIQGSGVLLFSERFDPSPLLYGGTGSESMNPDMPAFYPDRLEAGTLSYPAIISLAEGTLYLKRKMKDSANEIQRMTSELICGLKTIPGLNVYSAKNPFGIVSFSSDRLQSEFFAQELSDQFQIAVRGGLHCAPQMHRALGTENGGLVRVSISEFNTRREIALFLDAAQTIQRG